ncbi:MAG: hypothetical protein BAJALOKI1v1_890006 [Promethearchaeota archaeon]|nr:MAG: hypothetical protein BAJALOKI1v1_890006 [Candidatus Lokiarchaeota archaeon]
METVKEMEPNLDDYRKVGKEVYDKLRLLTYPVAIKFIKSYEEIPEKAQRPSKMGQNITLCQAFTMARRWGAHVAMTYEDNACITSSLVHQWKKVPVQDIIQSQVMSGYHKDAKAELLVQSQYSALNTKENYLKVKDHVGFIASPLTRTIVEPDVVLTYGDPSQMMHIIHALSYEGKYLVKSAFIGFGESCLKGVLMPFLSNTAEIVLPGTGDRTLALTKEEEMAIGMPAQMISYVNDTLFKSGGVFNMGEPTRFFVGSLPKGFGPPAWNFLKRKVKKKEREVKKKESS